MSSSALSASVSPKPVYPDMYNILIPDRSGLIYPWQIYVEGRSFTRFALHPNIPVALFHDSINSCKAQAGAFALFLGCKKRFENTCLCVRLHTDAVIRDG